MTVSVKGEKWYIGIGYCNIMDITFALSDFIDRNHQDFPNFLIAVPGAEKSEI